MSSSPTAKSRDRSSSPARAPTERARSRSPKRTETVSAETKEAKDESVAAPAAAPTPTPTSTATAAPTERVRKRKSGWDKGPSADDKTSSSDHKSESSIPSTSTSTPSTSTSTSTSSPLLPQSPLIATPTPTPQQILLQQQQAAILAQRQNLALLQQPMMAASAMGAGLATAGNKLDRRVYVGSLHYELTEEDVRPLFAAFGNILKIDMPKEPGTGRSKGFCFVEYSSPVEAQAAMALDGAMIGNRAIKVNRPTQPNTQPAAAPMRAGAVGAMNPLIMNAMANMGPMGLGGMGMMNPLMMQMMQQTMMQQTMQQAAMKMGTTGLLPTALTLPTQATPTPIMTPTQPTPIPSQPQPTTHNPACRIYVGSIYWDLNEEHVKTVFEAFGKVRACQLIMNPETGKHRGYGFVEFEEPKSAHDAIEAMNGFDLCGRQLKVNFATSMNNPNATGGQAPTPLLPSPSSNTSNHSSGGGGGVAGVALAQARAQQLAGSLPSVGNASQHDNTSLGSEENVRISSHSQRQAIMNKLARSTAPSQVIVLKNMVPVEEANDPDLPGEVKEECEKYGPVTKVHVHKSSAAVHIYVMFANESDATKARASLDNRYFGGRVVTADFGVKSQMDAGIYQ